MSNCDTTLSPRDLQTEVFSTWLNASILEIFCYAVYTVVYILSVYLIVFNSKGKFTPQRGAFAAVITVLWAVLTMRAGYVWHQVNVMYIEHGTSREDELFFYKFNAVTVFQTVLLYILLLLANLIMIWCTWTIFARRWLAIFWPMVTMLIEIVIVGIEVGVSEFMPVSASLDGDFVQLDSDGPGDRWCIVLFPLVLCTNTFCTVLIIGRIIYLTGWRNALRTYGGIINILVESAFIYSGTFIVYIAVLFSAANLGYMTVIAAYLYVSTLLPSITCFAQTLVILRVASGHTVTPSVVPSTGVSAPNQFADRTPDVDLESNAGM